MKINLDKRKEFCRKFLWKLSIKKFKTNSNNFGNFPCIYNYFYWTLVRPPYFCLINGISYKITGLLMDSLRNKGLYYNQILKQSWKLSLFLKLRWKFRSSNKRYEYRSFMPPRLFDCQKTITWLRPIWGILLLENNWLRNLHPGFRSWNSRQK